MPKYKLIYFDVKAKGEIIRLLFKVAGVPFEDFRLPVTPDLKPGEEWLKFKPSMPFGQIPILEVDGQQLAQSIAIQMFVAREFGLAGASSFDQARVLMWLEAGYDLYNEFAGVVGEQDPDKKEEKKTKIKTGSLKFFLDYLQKNLSANKSGYVIGDKLTAADVLAFQLREWMAFVGEDMAALYDSYSDVKRLNARVGAIPAVADWLKKRPKNIL